MARRFDLVWLCESIEEDPTYIAKPMFGGLAIYYQGKMVMVFTENPGDRVYRGVEHDFDIWNGVLYPTEREHHESLMADFPELANHPVLPKWLYLPMSAEGFENIAGELVEKIEVLDERFGIIPKPKKKKTKKKTKKKSVKKKTKKKVKK